MDPKDTTAVRRIDEAATKLQTETPRHYPEAVSVVLSGETFVSTLHDALTPAEKALSNSARGGGNRTSCFAMERV